MPLTRTTLPRGPLTATLCTNGTSGNGSISNSSGSSDPTVYRSTICNLAGRVHAVESKSLPLGANSMHAGTVSISSTLLMWAVKLSPVLMALSCFPGPDIHGKVVQAVYRGLLEGTTVA